MRRARHIQVMTAAAALVLAAALPCRAQDMTIEQSALLYDLLDPIVKGSAPPAGADPAIVGRAVAILKEEKLAGQNIRPHFQETGTLERYGKALFLGARTREFAPEIGHIRDLAARGDRPALEEALTGLWKKAGRAPPDAKALDPVIRSLYGAKDMEPEETVRHSFDRSGHRVDVTHARAGGRMQVNVTTKNADGTDKDRTVFSGVTETTPTPGGDELQRAIKLEKACTSTPETDKQTLEELNGEWTAGGKRWTVRAEKGGKVTLTEHRAAHGPLVYTGTYRLGRVQARHPIAKATDMGESLPMAVRSQLAGMGLDFRVYLEFCADAPGALRGTWSSQHVTYDGNTMKVDRIHDPYDDSLVLRRDSEEKIAQGAAPGERL